MAWSPISAARTQLRDAATVAIAGALDALEARVSRDRAIGLQLDRARQLDRTREVLERDRALAFATAARPSETARPTPPPAAPAPALRSARSATLECNEPIRTRSMAKLLAAQGHPERALAIY